MQAICRKKLNSGNLAATTDRNEPSSSTPQRSRVQSNAAPRQRSCDLSPRFVMTRIPHPSNRPVGLNLVDVAPLDPNCRRGLGRNLLDGRRLRRDDDRLLHYDGLGLNDHGLLNDDRLGLNDRGRRSRSHRIVNRRADQTAGKPNARPGPEVASMPAVMMVVTAAVPMMRRRAVMPGKCGSRNRDSRSQQEMFQRHILTWPRPASRRPDATGASCCGDRPSSRPGAP